VGEDVYIKLMASCAITQPSVTPPPDVTSAQAGHGVMRKPPARLHLDGAYSIDAGVK
jgi:hypothetical protein